MPESLQRPRLSAWDAALPFRAARQHDTAVILHLYYPELWDEISGYLGHLGNAFDLYVSIPTGVEFPDEEILHLFPTARIFRCENRGRDVLPFLVLFSAVSRLGYRYICKIHSKKSEHVRVGQEWGHDMLGKLLGSPEIIARIRAAFDQHPGWGIVGPAGHIVPREYFWEGNAARVEQLAASVGIPAATDFNYVAGTMFWFRPEALRLVLDLPLQPDDFEAEQGQGDGTLSHAFERFFGLAATAGSFTIAESDAQGVRPAAVSVHLRLLYEAYQKQRLDSRQQLDTLQSMLDEQIDELMAQVQERDDHVNELGVQVEERDSQLAEAHAQHQALAAQLQAVSNQLQAVSAQLRSILSSRAWRAAVRLQRLRAWLAPHGSTRARMARGLLSSYWRLRTSRDAALIQESGFFDRDWYLAHNPDVQQAGADPLRHYLVWGGPAGRDPGPQFSSRAYLEAYPEVKAAGANPLLHYLKFGRAEGRHVSSSDAPVIPVRSTKRGTRRSALDALLGAVRWAYLRLPLSPAARQKTMQLASRMAPGLYRQYRNVASGMAAYDEVSHSEAVAAESEAGQSSGTALLARLLSVDPGRLSSWATPRWHAEPLADAGAAALPGPGSDQQTAALPSFTVQLLVNEAPAHLLRNAIESVRRQSYVKWELDLRVSPSGPWDAEVLAAEFANVDGRVHVSSAVGNAIADWSASLSAVRGDYVVVLDGRDELTPAALEQAARELSRGACDVVCDPGSASIDADQVDDGPLAFAAFIAWKKEFLEKLLAQACALPGSDVQRFSQALRPMLDAASVGSLADHCYTFREIPGRIAGHIALAEGKPSLQFGIVRTRVLVDARLLNRQVTGTERYLLELLSALAALRHEYHLELQALVYSRPAVQFEGVEFVLSDHLAAIQRCDIFHKAFPASDVSTLAEMAVAPCVAFTPLDLILYTNPDYFADPAEYPRYRAIMRLAADLSDRIISISRHGKREIVRLLGIPEQRVEPIHLGVRPEHFADLADKAGALAGLDLPETYFLYVGTDYPHKNLLTLLRAFQVVRRTAPGAHLVLVGTNYYLHPQPELNALLRKLSRWVHRLGHVPDEVLPALYRNAKALVYPSLDEGFGLPLLEAMLSGTAVVASNATSIPEVTGEQAALLVDGRDESQIAAAMLRILEEPALRERLIQAGYERAAAFRWEKTARETVECYRDAIASAVRRPAPAARLAKLEAISRLQRPGPTILLVSHFRFYPPAAGNEQRVFRMVKYLKKLGYRIIMLVHPLSDAPKPDREARKVIDQYVDYYEELGDVAWQPLPASESPIGREQILERWKATEQAFCPDGEMARAARLIEQYSPSVLLAEYIWASRVFALARPDMLKVIDTIDMFSHKDENVVSFGIQDSLAATPDEERAFINRSDVIIAIQDSEAEGFRALAPSCEVISAGIDLDVPEQAAAQASPDTSTPTLLMIGSGNHINVHCAREFLAEAWPRIRQRVPGCRLRIVGKVCASLSSDDPSVELIPYARDLDAVYAQATMVVNPVYAGTGIKVKSVEALGHGKVLLSWPEGVAGLTSGDADPFIVIRSWEELADAVADLASHPDRRRALEAAALDFARSRLTDRVIYRQLADRLDTFCNRKLRVLCLYLRYGTDDYPHAMADLQAWYSAKMQGTDTTTWIIDNKIEGNFDGVDLDTGFRLLSGDNAQWEFSAFQKVLAEHRAELGSYDVIHFVTSAFNTLYTRYLDHFAAENLQFVAHRRLCLGHIDSYDEPVQLNGTVSQSWIRTCFFFLSPESAYSLPGFVAFEQPEQFFDAEGNFLPNAPIGGNYRGYITGWLRGETIQGVAWHNRALEPAAFVRKTLAILNEHTLSQRLRQAGIDLVDFYWLVNNSAALRSAWACRVPDWAEQISTRGAGPLAVSSS